MLKIVECMPRILLYRSKSYTQLPKVSDETHFIELWRCTKGDAGNAYKISTRNIPVHIIKVSNLNSISPFEVLNIILYKL